MRNRIYPLSRSYRCTDTGSVTLVSPPDPLFSIRTRLQQCGELLRIPTFWRGAKTPESLPGHTHNTLKRLTRMLQHFPYQDPLPSGRRLSPLALSWRTQNKPTLPVRSPCSPPTLSISPCSYVCALVNTPKHNHTSATLSYNSGTCSFTTKYAFFYKTPRTSTSSAPVL